ncbi:MAG: endolytic transglycosylase MltG [Elusimicrobia bacterium]|nr:endolytic transglycosylase MltG [Elusimicrobiota bacterium]
MRPRAAIPVVLISLVLAGGWLNSPPKTSHEELLRVPAGASASRVARELERSGLIRSRPWFLFLVHLSGASGRLQSGTYLIAPGKPASRILADLVNGRTRRVRVTVPEGFASWQIADALEKEGVCKAADFAAAVSTGSAEGFLYPETYYFDENTTAGQVVEAMTARFLVVWKELEAEAQAGGRVSEVVPSTVSVHEDRLRLPDGKFWTALEIVTLASLVEREARREDERALISAVYHNRLKKRMLLESDPTVQFSLGYWKDRLFYRDLDVQSPYNTYRRRGLPPGPICSPGRAARFAAFSPARSEHLYFVADEQGGHQFSASYEEHLRQVRERNRRRRQNRSVAP